MELKINYYAFIIAVILCSNISAQGSRSDRSRIYDLRLNALIYIIKSPKIS
jgi:hypothetical protein